jgi:hypothetical protein
MSSPRLLGPPVASGRHCLFPDDDVPLGGEYQDEMSFLTIRESVGLGREGRLGSRSWVNRRAGENCFRICLDGASWHDQKVR